MKKVVILSVILITLLAFITGCKKQEVSIDNGSEVKTSENENKANENQPQNNEQQKSDSASKATKAVMQTSMGDIELELRPKDAPKTVENFVKLVKKGFYDGLIFHRVIPGFMIQGGDPKGDGTGGPGYQFEDENSQNVLGQGILAMANSGPNTNGSQFFIMTAKQPMSLQGQYNIFGKVTKGQDVADNISVVERDQNDKPLKDVVLKKVIIK